MYTVLGLVLLHAHYGSTKNLNLVFIIFRHGDRTNDIFTTYPKDPYRDELYYPYGYGELTNKGKERMYSLGVKLRERYANYLDAVYSPDDIHASTTKYSRTQTSLQLVLAGLYPPHCTELEWNTNINWNPISFTINEELTHMPILNQPEYRLLYMKYLDSDLGREIDEKYKKWYKYLSMHSGLNVTSSLEMARLYYCFMSEEEWGMKLPFWSIAVYPNILRNATTDFFKTLSGTSALKQRYGGAFLNNILSIMRHKIYGNAPSSPKMYLYSVHDHNIISLLAAMEVYLPHLPPYSASVIIELIKEDDSYCIQVRYDDSSGTLQELFLPGCHACCPLQVFNRIVRANLPPTL